MHVSEEFCQLRMTSSILKYWPFSEELWPQMTNLLKAGVTKPSYEIKNKEQKNHQNLSENRIPKAIYSKSDHYFQI